MQLLVKSSPAYFKQMTVVNEDGGRTNMYAIEPEMQVMDVEVPHNENAEILNGRFAMLGFVIAVGTYVTTGQIIPGVF